MQRLYDFVTFLNVNNFFSLGDLDLVVLFIGFDECFMVYLCPYREFMISELCFPVRLSVMCHLLLPSIHPVLSSFLVWISFTGILGFMLHRLSVIVLSVKRSM